MHALTTKTRFAAGQKIVSPIKPTDAAASRDALAKVSGPPGTAGPHCNHRCACDADPAAASTARLRPCRPSPHTLCPSLHVQTLYSRLFTWLVSRINESIGQDPTADAVIGVLDIYGFEHFARNDLEQFCINLANEKLQQHFNTHVFKTEQAEYARDGIQWSYIDFVDNQDVLDLIEGKGGLIPLLDEACRLGTQATPEDVRDRLAGAPAAKGDGRAAARFSVPRLDRRGFTIAHYAGDVMYSTDNFLEKNSDQVVREHTEMLAQCEDAFVKALLTPEEVEGLGAAPGRSAAGPTTKFTSVCSRFQKQLADLMAALSAMQPHYVRCIKPNAAGVSGAFEAPQVLQQLRCGGVLEAVRISCAGYPSRLSVEEFAGRFWHVVPSVRHGGAPTRELVEAVLRHCGVEDYQMGRTKVFLRAGERAKLERARAMALDVAARAIQVRGRVRHARTPGGLHRAQKAKTTRRRALSLDPMRVFESLVHASPAYVIIMSCNLPRVPSGPGPRSPGAPALPPPLPGAPRRNRAAPELRAAGRGPAPGDAPAERAGRRAPPELRPHVPGRPVPGPRPPRRGGHPVGLPHAPRPGGVPLRAHAPQRPAPAHGRHRGGPVGRPGVPGPQGAPPPARGGPRVLPPAPGQGQFGDGAHRDPGHARGRRGPARRAQAAAARGAGSQGAGVRGAQVTGLGSQCLR